MYKSYSKNANELVIVLLDTAFGLLFNPQTFFFTNPSCRNNVKGGRRGGGEIQLVDTSMNRSKVHSLQE